MGFFGGMPFPVQFFLAFVIVLGLIGATAWAVRRFGAGRLGGGGLRGRQPRLAVIDYASVDGRRRLLLIRRDNVEHLVMIGGPTDVVVESNIVRAAPASRDVAVPRAPAIESAQRAIPLPDNATNGAWPLQPEPAAASAAARMPRGEHANEESWPLQPQTEARPRPQRDTLAALADELAPRAAPAAPPPPPRSRPQPSARPHAAEPRPEPRQETRPEARQEIRQETRPEPRMPAAPAASAESASIDQSLADMAQKLEAALRKPKADRADPNGAAGASLGTDAPSAAAPAPAAALARNRPIDTRPAARTEAKPQPNPGKTLYDSLEQEMASLLGRSSAKN
jgi:flagellar protein FliO/FliZ